MIFIINGSDIELDREGWHSFVETCIPKYCHKIYKKLDLWTTNFPLGIVKIDHH